MLGLAKKGKIIKKNALKGYANTQNQIIPKDDVRYLERVHINFNRINGLDFFRCVDNNSAYKLQKRGSAFLWSLASLESAVFLFPLWISNILSKHKVAQNF